MTKNNKKATVAAENKIREFERTATFEARWTGSYPCLCYGVWKIEKNGIDVSSLIPNDILRSPMGTQGTYRTWHFEDGMEVFDYYEDGLPFKEWFEENRSWICRICRSEDEAEILYGVLQSKDWRHNSCGGCI